MSGGFYKPKGRGTYRVWYPWKGEKIFVNKYLDGTGLYHEAQCQRVLEKLRSEVDQGIFDPALWGKEKALQFEKAWAIYQEQCPCGEDRTNSRERIFVDFFLPYFKGKSLREIEEHHIMEWWSGIPKTYAPSYLRVIRATLHAFFTFHPVTRKKMFKFPVVKVPYKTPEWLNRDEQEKLLLFISMDHQPIFKFLQFYGCRVSEACSLKRTDIDWGKNIITFRERKNDKENTLPLFEDIKAIIRSEKISHFDYVFCTVNGEKYSRQVLYRIWTDACRRSGVKTIPLKNATRHSLACQLLERGESAMTVSRILGNTPGMIERAYGTISVKRVEEVLRINLQSRVVSNNLQLPLIRN